MAFYTAKTLRKALGITVIATFTNFTAPCNRIPGCVSPINITFISHCTLKIMISAYAFDTGFTKIFCVM